MNHKKMHAVIAEVGVQWDPEKWNGDTGILWILMRLVPQMNL